MSESEGEEYPREDDMDDGQEPVSNEEEEQDDNNGGGLDDSEESEDDENDLLDMEAVESGEESDQDSEEEEDDVQHFPQFSRLPIELRHHIWELVDIDLRSKGRVFDVMPMLTNRDTAIELWESATLSSQTAGARAMLATNKESRELALHFYPDTLPIRGGRGVLRYHSAKDVLLLLYLPSARAGFGGGITVWDFVARAFPGVTNVAIDGDLVVSALDDELMDSSVFSSTLWPDPWPAGLEDKRLMVCTDAYQFDGYKLRWTTTDSAQQFCFNERNSQPYGSPEVEYQYCWPKPGKEADYAAAGIKPIVDDDYEAPPTSAQTVWRMIRFDFSDLRLWDRLQIVAQMPGDWKENWGEHGIGWIQDSDSSDENEYESEGINDGPLEGDSDDSDEEEDHLAFDSDNTGEAANFSSVEPESPAVMNGLEEDEEDDDDDDEAPATIVERAKRKIVDSDDEGAVVLLPTRKRPRVVLSDSEEDGEGEPTIATRRRRRIAEDSSDEGEDGGEEASATAEEDSEESEDEEDEAPPARQTLAERLQLFRTTNPVSDEEDPDAETDGEGDDFVNGGDNNFQDDEEGDELDVEDEDGATFEGSDGVQDEEDDE